MPQALQGLAVLVGPGVQLSGEGAPRFPAFGDALIGEMQSRLVTDGFNVVQTDPSASAVHVEIRAELEVSRNSFLMVNGKPLESNSARIQVKVLGPNGALLDAFDTTGSPGSDSTPKEVAAQLSERMKGSQRLLAFAKSGTAPAPQPADTAPSTGAKVASAHALASNTTAHSNWPDVASKLANQKDGTNDAAVIVAIERYDSLIGIPGAVSNGEAWFHYLTETRGVPRAHVQVLQNEEARDQQINKAVSDAVGQAQTGGKLWFVFIGHGAPSHDQHGLLVGYDAYQTAEGLEDRSVKTEQLLRDLRASRGTPIVILDACFSGRSTQGDSLVKGLMPSAVVKTTAPSGTLVMTAAQSDQFAGGLPGGDRPAFSYLALGALRGWADTDGNGTVTASEVQSYVGDTMRILLAGQRQQTPTLDGDRREFVLARTAESEPAALKDLLVGAKGQP
jgi:hypothetical protein